MKKIVIDSNKLLLRLSAIENEKLIDFKTNNKLKSSILGNIYKGKIINVVKEKKCAFVDLGEGNVGFLNFKAVKGKSKVLSGGDIIVQVSSDSVGTKVPKITTEISFKGFYMVLLLNSDKISFSKKIQSQEKKEFLRGKISKFLPKNCGVIIRTEAENEDIDKIIEEFKRLINMKEQVESFYVLGKSPKLIRESEDIINSFINIHSRNGYEIITNDGLLYKELIHRYSSKNVKLFKENNIFDHFKISNEIEKIFSREIKLNNGGFIVFDKTEAFHVIDVNSGKQNEAINKSVSYSVNIQAIDEIVKQIKFRSISGIILIDLIDLDSKNENDKLIAYANKKLKKINCYVLGLTKLGILEVTRKREHRDIIEEYYDKCSKCSGFGYERNFEDDGTSFINEIRRMSYHYNSESFKFIMKNDFFKYVKENYLIDDNGKFYEDPSISIKVEISNSIKTSYKISY